MSQSPFNRNMYHGSWLMAHIKGTPSLWLQQRVKRTYFRQMDESGCPSSISDHFGFNSQKVSLNFIFGCIALFKAGSFARNYFQMFQALFRETLKSAMNSQSEENFLLERKQHYSVGETTIQSQWIIKNWISILFHSNLSFISQHRVFASTSSQINIFFFF